MRPGHYVVRTWYGNKLVTTPLWRLADLHRKLITRAGVDLIPTTARWTSVSTSLTARLAARKCSACNSETGPFHIHHTNPMRNTKDAPFWRQKASGRIRKTMVLCAPCHRGLHSGRAIGKAATRWEGEPCTLKECKHGSGRGSKVFSLRHRLPTLL